MHRESNKTAERGVSEVVAFTLVFGIILGSVALVYAAGFPAMLSYQESEQVTNAERAFNAMAENFNDVPRYDAIDERSSEITLRGGTLTTGGESSNLTIAVDDENFREEYVLGSLVYTHDDRSVALEGGAVIRADDDGSIITKDPRFYCGDDVAVLALLVIDASERNLMSVESQEVTIRERDTEVHQFRGGSYDVELDHDATDRHETAWERYVDEWNPQCSGVSSVTIRVTTVSLRF